MPKESLMIKYSSDSYFGIVFHRFIETLRELHGDKMAIIIVDMLDNLSVVKYQAEAFDIDIENVIDTISVVKVGGSSFVGDVKRRLDISPSYLIHRERFRDQFESLLSEFSDRDFIVVITLGLDKFLTLLDKRETALYP
nr:DUF257 family protein [Thermococcus barophilus]